MTDRAEALGTLKVTLDREHLHDNSRSRDIAYYHLSVRKEAKPSAIARGSGLKPTACIILI